MEKLNKAKTGLTVALFFVVVHLVWLVMVGIGVAQRFMDWIFSLHMIDNPFLVTKFTLGPAIGLLVMVFVFGYVFGWIFAALWNSLRK